MPVAHRTAAIRELVPLLFVQEIARQSIIDEESIVGKETGYEGFGVIPILSESLFGNLFMLQYYEPMQKMYYSIGEELTER